MCIRDRLNVSIVNNIFGIKVEGVNAIVAIKDEKSMENSYPIVRYKH